MNLAFMTIQNYGWGEVSVASGVTMRILGMQKLINNLKAAGPRGTKAIGAGLYLEGNNIMGDSKKQVPVDFGALKNSGYVTLPVMSGNNVAVELGYGGAARDYVIPQHERTDFKHPEGGKAKYLQDPLMSAAGGFAKNVNNYASHAFAANKGANKVSGMPDKPE